jgi:hypothetical protein
MKTPSKFLRIKEATSEFFFKTESQNNLIIFLEQNIKIFKNTFPRI